MADLCFYNPKFRRACYTGEDGACPNLAEVIVGHTGNWRLCESCAALPEFKRFRKRKRIERAKEERETVPE